jgi:hypothetical protein
MVSNPYDVNVTPTWANSLDGTYPQYVSMMTALETRWNAQDSTSMHNYDGWFKAPASGEYRFYLQGDD